MNVVQVAQVCHEANRALRRALGETDDGDWFQVSQETRNSAVDGVRAARNGATSKQSHENWLDFKRDHGWVYGPVKNEALKQHPCIVAYEDLPADQKIKDHLFIAIVTALS